MTISKNIIQALIVDGNKQTAECLAVLLKKYENMQLMGIADRGLEGLSMVSSHHPTLLFLDMDLPDISGLDFLDRLNLLTQGQCRTVVCTANSEYILPAFRKQAFDVLRKPMSEQELDGIMRRLVDSLDSSQPMPTNKRNDSKLLFYTNTLDFRLIDKRDIGLFQYNHDLRCWEVVLGGSKAPIKLKRNVKSDMLVALDEQFVQVNQKFIINLNYLIEVVDNRCHFYPPFDGLDYVKVGRLFRRKLIDHFCCL